MSSHNSSAATDINIQGWFGVKRWTKLLFGNYLINAVLRAFVRPFAKPGSKLARLPVNIPEVRADVLGRTVILRNPMRCSIAKSIYWGRGKWEPQEQFALELFCTLAQDANTVLDIGANTGLFVLGAAAHNPEIRGYAFEIVPEVYQQLFGNCARNDVLARIECKCVGLGAPGQELRIPTSLRSSELPSSISANTQFDYGALIPFETLDDWTSRIAESSVVLIKIDVEGTEHEVFKHGSEFLQRFKPDILCEVLLSNKQPELLEAALSPLGYRYYRISDVGVEAMDTIAQHRRWRDWLFTTKTPEELSGFVARAGERIV